MLSQANKQPPTATIAMTEQTTTITRIKSNDPTLGKLYLTYPPSTYFQENEIDEFAKALSNNTHIQYVLLERRFVWGLSPATYAAIIKAVTQLPGLLELEIFSVRVPLATLCEALQHAKRLFRLCLGMVTLTQANEDCSALGNHPSLQYFCLSDFRFLEDEENKNLDSLWMALSTCPRISNVEIFSNQSPENPWTANGLASLADSTSLDQLTLRRLRLIGVDVIAFSNQLRNRRHQSNLRGLNLTKNKLGDGGCVSIAQAVSVSGVTELDLRDNQLGAEGSRAVIPLLLGQTSRLEKLNLAKNPISDQGAEHLAEILGGNPPNSLKHLDLAQASISNAGCSRLATALTTNSTLLSLNLSRNNLSNETYIAFGEALKTHNRTLVYLGLQVDRTRIDTSGCAALLSMVEENYVLETVNTSLGAGSFYDGNGQRHGQKAMYAYYIRIFLRLNHAGRQKLLEQRGTKEDWVNALVAVNDSLHAINYLISTNPSMCQQ